MCWWTMERSLEVAYLLRRPPAEIDDWEGLRDDIRDDVLENGWNEELQAFTEAYQGTEVDAATLWIGLAGLVPPDDTRFHSTLRAIEKSLRSGPTVYRYKWDDGMPGREGGFHICTTWMIEAYLRTGRRIEAESLFAQYLACLGPTGLMPEMYDPVEERGLGNHPQAYSHLGLIRCAQLLDD
jgi:GH15 family glucan-1,4-alpha-glucosidase